MIEDFTYLRGGSQEKKFEERPLRGAKMLGRCHLLQVALAGVLVALFGAILPARMAARTSVVNVLNLE